MAATVPRSQRRRNAGKARQCEHLHYGRNPGDFSEAAWAPRGMAPRLGEHGDEILRSLGRRDAEIEAPVAAGTARRDLDVPIAFDAATSEALVTAGTARRDSQS